MKKLTIRIDDDLNDVIEQNAAKAKVSVNKYVGDILTGALAGEINIASRLDNYESNIYALQYLQNTESAFLQQTMRVLFSRTDMMMDMLKNNGFKAPDSKLKVEKAKDEIGKLVKRSVQETENFSDIWQVSEIQTE